MVIQKQSNSKIELYSSKLLLDSLNNVFMFYNIVNESSNILLEINSLEIILVWKNSNFSIFRRNKN